MEGVWDEFLDSSIWIDPRLGLEVEEDGDLVLVVVVVVEFKVILMTRQGRAAPGHFRGGSAQEHFTGGDGHVFVLRPPE